MGTWEYILLKPIHVVLGSFMGEKKEKKDLLASGHTGQKKKVSVLGTVR